METVENIPIVSIDDPEESDEVTVLMEVEPPSVDDVLNLYKLYREGGGDPYEPYEAMLRERDNGTSETPTNQGTQPGI
jgi:hypothetical protein